MSVLAPSWITNRKDMPMTHRSARRRLCCDFDVDAAKSMVRSGDHEGCQHCEDNPRQEGGYAMADSGHEGTSRRWTVVHALRRGRVVKQSTT